ncbi:MAG: ABC transporter ATP-binding protein [Chloroflexi bacterium]|nr:ABC transporter ATP-binding protein [Chloroflexota bacterium]
MLPNIPRGLLSTYLRPQWPRVVVLGLLLFAGVSLQLANPQVARLFIDRAQAGEPFTRLVWIALLFIGVAALSQVATVAETYVAEDLGWRTTNALRADLTRHVLDLDASFHTEHTPGELIERIDGDVSAIADFFARFVVQVLGSGVFLIGVLGLLFVEDWRIGGLLSCCVLSVLVFIARGGGFVGVRSRTARSAAADVSAFLEERLGGLPDLKANGADAFTLEGMETRLWSRFHAMQRSVMAASIFNAVVAVLFVLGSAGALGLSAALYGVGAISLGSVYVVFRYAGMLRQPLDRLTRQMSNFLQATGAMVRVAELLETRRSLIDHGRIALSEGALALEVRNISFAYGQEAVLHDVSIRLEPGEILGLLGRTGSGKTTLSRLLFRLHDPAEGEVRLGGVDVRQINLEELRARVGLVTQDVQVFGGTLRDNVVLFDASVSDARVREVFAHLELGAWLASLPEGLDTLVGPGGRGLSAGEAQLVALARVFLKSPGLVVFDEASSRLDPATEQMLERAVSRLLEQRTGVVIAHRLATVERADRIVILDNGRVVESGRRHDLKRDPHSHFSHLLRVGLSEALA